MLFRLKSYLTSLSLRGVDELGKIPSHVMQAAMSRG